MSDIYIALIYVLILGLGFVAPFVLTLGYVWVEVFYPQFLSSYLTEVPVAMIMGAAAVGAYVLADRRSPPRITPTMMLTLAMAVWVTITTVLWAVAPDLAWQKWDWAFKTVVFSALLPFFIRSRVQIEAFIQVYTLGAIIHVVPFGLKTILSGGGYGQNLGVITGNSLLTEGSTLSAVAIMFIPLLLYLRRHSVLVSSPHLRLLLYGGYAVVCVPAALGTFARSAVIGFGVLGLSLWLQSRRKLRLAVLFAIIIVGFQSSQSDSWKERISTIKAPTQESSANTRILVWKWTLQFAGEHPQGGGFNAYVTNRFEDDDGNVSFGRAFHSIYFEVLGEQGWPGLSIFLALMLVTILSLRRTIWRARDWPQLAWCGDLARALMASLFVLMACGSFIGIAFQPTLWYLFGLTTCLQQYLRRVQQDKAAAGSRSSSSSAEASAWANAERRM